MQAIRKHIRIPGIVAAAVLGVALLLWSAPSVQGRDLITMAGAFGDGVTVGDKTFTAGETGSKVEDRTYTAGFEISYLGLSDAEVEALRLPRATSEFCCPGPYTYTATGLPAGLYLTQDRLIRGTPEAATKSPAEVDYTARDQIGGSVTTHFHITVAPPVVFDAEQRQAFKSAIFEYTVGQAEPINVTLPVATGGHGALTYGLSYVVKEQRTVDGRTITGRVDKSVNDDAPGFSFDASTRVLSSDPAWTHPRPRPSTAWTTGRRTRTGPGPSPPTPSP